MRFPFSFRWRILLVVLAVGVVPLVLIGFWLTGTTARSGETLLRERLRSALRQDVQGVEVSWVSIRSRLLDLSDSPPLQSLLLAEAPADGEAAAADESRHTGAAAEIDLLFDRVAVDVPGIAVLDRREDTLLLLGQARSPEWSNPGAPAGALRVSLPIRRARAWEVIGTLSATVSLSALRPASTSTALSGGVLSALDPETGAALLPTPFDPSLLGEPLFDWNGERWVAERSRALEPSIIIVAAAPLAPFSEPFRSTAFLGSMILLLVALVGAGMAWILTRRITASLERVETAASAVAAGDLGRTVPDEGDDEVGRLARSFNRMSESLRSTLSQVAERESLSAVNEFAAALAHEVRNPLTSIQIDLQQVEESLPEDSEFRRIQSQALGDLLRLNRAVQGALETARSGTILPRTAALLGPIENAIRSTLPHAQEKGVVLGGPPSGAAPAPLEIDSDAVERVILNLLLNAVEATPPGGQVRVTLGEEAGKGAWVRVEDQGVGMDPEDLDRAFDAFFSTRPGGTGVGLSIARRIVVAHGGEIRLESTPDQGTVATVFLPQKQGTTPA